MANYKSFDLLNKLYFVRTGGSDMELKAANIILDEIKSLGGSGHLEEFLVDGYTIHESKLVFKNPDMEIDCVGVGQSSSTPAEGLSAEFIYITSYDDAKIKNPSGKICLVHSKIVNYKLYELLVKRGAKGLILCTGSVYTENENVDLDPYMYRERHYKFGKIPAVCIRMKDAEKVLRLMPKEAAITVIQDEMKNKSHNVVATIPGSDLKDEIVSFTAHYDSVSYSKGAYDNATGSATIMQMFAYFMENKPRRTLKFIWCGSEEMGLLGSKAYCSMHKEELDNYLLSINVDMTGVTIGYDLAECSSEMGLVSFIKYLGYIEGFSIESKQGVYSSDSTPFADSGVPSVSFARLAPSGGAKIHSHDDVIDYLSEDNYYRTCDFIASFASKLINAQAFPVDRTIPEKVKNDLDIYLGRKERS